MSKSTLQLIRNALEARGFSEIKTPPAPVTRDRWYRRALLADQMTCVLRLSYKPAAQAYSVYAGVVHAGVRTAIVDATPVMMALLPTMYFTPFPYVPDACWTMFNAGRALRWESVYIMPAAQKGSAWPAPIEQLMGEFLEPVIFSIKDETDLMQLLLRNDAPFGWMATNPVLRAAEIIALGSIADAERTDLETALSPFQYMITQACAEGNDYGRVSAELFRALTSPRFNALPR